MSELQNAKPSVKDRIAARRASAAASSPTATSTPDTAIPAGNASGATASRTDRFSRYRDKDAETAQAAFVPETGPQSGHPPAAPAVAPATPPAARPAPAAVALSRSERFRTAASAPRGTPAPHAQVARVADQGLPPWDDQDEYTSSESQNAQDSQNRQMPTEPWADPNRPAGSAYSEEEWAAAEAANPGCVVFELLKSHERGLLAKPCDAMDEVFSRSLVIHEKAETPYRSHATVRIEHHGEFGVFSYAVVRTRIARERSSWVDGAKQIMRDLNHVPPEQPQGTRGQQGSRSQRYRG